MPRIRLSVCIVGIAVLLAGCSSSTPTPTPVARPGGTPGAPNATGAPTLQGVDKADQVLVQLIAIYQTRGFDAAVQFARDQSLMTTQDEVRITLILDSDDPSVVDSTALAVGRLGGRVAATVGTTIEVVVPVKTLLGVGAQSNQQTILTDLNDFQHVKDIRRTPTANPSAGTDGGH